MNKVVIKTDGTLSSVVVDGVDYSMKASKVVFEYEAGAIPTVSITLPADELEISGVVGSFIRSERTADNRMANAWVNALTENSPENSKEITPERFSIWLQNEIKQSLLKVIKEEVFDEGGKSFDY